MTDSQAIKAGRSPFLRQNPFPNPLTEGLFYRDKMRAIHRVAPEGPLRTILEVGGGSSGLTAMLYPDAKIVNVDLEAAHGHAPLPTRRKVSFVCGDATRLPFSDTSFDAVTLFDVLEHIPDDRRALEEAWRLLRSGGFLLLSSPNAHWRFPYYRAFKPLCPTDAQVMADWGHVRRGYSSEELEQLVGAPIEARATFINPVLVIGHDVAFSRLPAGVRRRVCAAVTPLSWLGYAAHRAGTRGTETAYRWRKP